MSSGRTFQVVLLLPGPQRLSSETVACAPAMLADAVTFAQNRWFKCILSTTTIDKSVLFPHRKVKSKCKVLNLFHILNPLSGLNVECVSFNAVFTPADYCELVALS